MVIALYGRNFNDQAIPYVQELVDCLQDAGLKITVFESFLVFLNTRIQFKNPLETYDSHDDLVFKVDFLISLGGDGTLLDTVTLVRDSGIPVVGINLGRLGFLASINKDSVRTAVESLVKGHFTLDKRTLLRLESDVPLFNGLNYALNELTIHKKDTSSMIIIHTYLNGEFLNSYWADGLIIATPTGSTAYSLSCGGPIIFPRSGNFVITPISPHNLNVRPVILSDSNTITFEVEGRSSYFLVTLDSRTEIIDSSVQLAVRKENFEINLLRLNNENYLTTLRNKLMWGLDTRN
ncbi:MAG: NAD kinase [Ignavibacteria bacterium]|nr:NAD kinase [Ignavibacteria bacterium]